MRNVNWFTALAVLALASAAVTAARAQSSGGPYRIDRVVIASGGSPAGGGPYQVSGTFGQAAIATLQFGGLAMFDGFWSPVTATVGDRIFANGFDP